MGRGADVFYLSNPISCNMKVKNGDTVRVEYTVKLEDGSVFERTPEDRPLEFTMGEKKVVLGFEKAILGMKLNEKKSFTLKPAEGFGERRDSLVKEIPKILVPKDVTLKVGDELKVEVAGSVIPAKVQEINDKVVLLDANHPLAGKTVTFNVKVMSIDKNEGQKRR